MIRSIYSMLKSLTYNLDFFSVLKALITVVLCYIVFYINLIIMMMIIKLKKNCIKEHLEKFRV